MSEFLNSAAVQEKLDEAMRARITSETVMQCRICWYRYEPQNGCEESQTPPGTPFDALDADWCCPHCGNGKNVFFPVENDA